MSFRELRQIRLAVDDRAGRTQPRHDGRVLRRHVPAVGPAPARRPDPARLDRVLDRDRETVQWAKRVAAGTCRVRSACLASGPLGCEGDDASDRAVEPFDSIEVELEQLEGADLPRAKRPYERRRALVGEGVVEPVHGCSLSRARRIEYAARVILDNGVVRTLDRSLPTAGALGDRRPARGRGRRNARVGAADARSRRSPGALRASRVHRRARPLSDVVARAA